jgi:hypothetical protein
VGDVGNLVSISYDIFVFTFFLGCVGEAQIAWGTSTGGVGLVTITQSLNSCPSKTAYGPTFSVRTRMEHQVQKVFNPDKRGLTALTWVVSNKDVTVSLLFSDAYAKLPSS